MNYGLEIQKENESEIVEDKKKTSITQVIYSVKIKINFVHSYSEFTDVNNIFVKLDEDWYLVENKVNIRIVSISIKKFKHSSMILELSITFLKIFK